MSMQPVLAASLGLAVGLATTPAAAHGSAPLTVQFNGCTEFVGVAFVDATSARALVPAAYTVVSDAAGARLVVRAADCAAVRVGNAPARPGRVAQIGLIIVSPDGTAVDPNTAINNYTLTYASNSPALVLALRAAGVPAALDTGLAFEVSATPSGGSEFYASASPELDASATWHLHGSVNPPVVPTSFLANWWRLNGTRETKMATDIAAISFDFSSQVAFATSRSNVVGQLLGRNGIASFPVSFHGSFAAGTMTVSVRR